MANTNYPLYFVIKEIIQFDVVNVQNMCAQKNYNSNIKLIKNLIKFIRHFILGFEWKSFAEN